jgi:hypothetical protein
MDGEFIFTANERDMEESLFHMQEELIKGMESPYTVKVPPDPAMEGARELPFSTCKKELIKVFLTGQCVGSTSTCKELIKLLGTYEGGCAPLDGKGMEEFLFHPQGAHKSVWKRRGV